MAAYSANADIVNEFKSLDITSGVIDSTKIDEFIDQSDAYINGRIGLVYKTPVTGTESLKILKNISIGLVAERIARILKTKSASPTGDQLVFADLIVQAKADLDLIADRKLLLSDADERSTQAGVQSFSSENLVVREFKLNVDQW